MSGRSTLSPILLCACLVAFSAQCKRLHVDPAPLPRDTAVADPGVDAPRLQLTISGEDASRDDFARALTQYRIIFSRLHNESGTLSDLFRSAARESLRRSGLLLLEDGATEEAADLEVRIDEWLLLWIPPREFIQTPAPFRRGEVRVDLKMSFLGADASPEGCSYQESIDALPGEEVFFLETLTANALRHCALRFGPWAAQELKAREQAGGAR